MVLWFEDSVKEEYEGTKLHKDITSDELNELSDIEILRDLQIYWFNFSDYKKNEVLYTRINVILDLWYDINIDWFKNLETIIKKHYQTRVKELLEMKL